MRIRSWLPAVALFLALAPMARAQDFGVMNSAETINPGNIKLMVYPILVFEDDSTVGIVARGGYGFTSNIDGEVMVGFYDGGTVFGGELEYWLLKGNPLDVSVSGGLHLIRADAFDTIGVDLTGLASYALQDRIELYGALDFAREFVDEGESSFDADFNTFHVVGGFEFKLAENIDLDAEFGLALNKEADSYLAGGAAYYIR